MPLNREGRISRSPLKLCTWNCEGWLNKLDLTDLIANMQNNDILCLNETFVSVDNYDYTAFDDFHVYVAKAVQITEGTRKSGGVLVFVKKHLSPFIKRIDVEYEHMVVLLLDKTLLNVDDNVIMICLYIYSS